MGESARQLRVNLPVKQGWVKAVYAARTGLLTFGVVSVCGRGWAGECYSSSVQCPGCARHKENQGKVTRARVVAARTSLKESKQLLYPPCPEALWSAAERAAGPQ